MIVNLLPGASPETVRERLALAVAALANGRSGSPGERWEAYVNWANDSAASLRGLLTTATIERLILTPNYWRIVTLVHVQATYVGHLVDREVADRLDALSEATRWLEGRLRAQPRARPVVVDTSFYIHAAKLEDVEFQRMVGSRADPIHLFVPMVVLDELDRLKDAGRQPARWRAAYTLAVLERVIRRPGEPAELQAEDFSPLSSGGIPRGRVTVEVVLDPTGHERLPLEDDELIDRSVALQALSATPLTFLTFDTGQAMRARAANLAVTRLEHPAESEPEPT